MTPSFLLALLTIQVQGNVAVDADPYMALQDMVGGLIVENPGLKQKLEDLQTLVRDAASSHEEQLMEANQGTERALSDAEQDAATANFECESECALKIAELRESAEREANEHNGVLADRVQGEISAATAMHEVQIEEANQAQENARLEAEQAATAHEDALLEANQAKESAVLEEQQHCAHTIAKLRNTAEFDCVPDDAWAVEEVVRKDDL